MDYIHRQQHPLLTSKRFATHFNSSPKPFHILSLYVTAPVGVKLISTLGLLKSYDDFDVEAEIETGN